MQLGFPGLVPKRLWRVFCLPCFPAVSPREIIFVVWYAKCITALLLCTSSLHQALELSPLLSRLSLFRAEADSYKMVGSNVCSECPSITYIRYGTFPSSITDSVSISRYWRTKSFANLRMIEGFTLPQARDTDIASVDYKPWWDVGVNQVSELFCFKE
jgi:hypothetical protein